MRFFYGRKLPKKFSKKKHEYLKSSIFFFSESVAKEKIKIFSKKFFSLDLEIGIGTGENIIYLARKDHLSGFIGCDPYLKGHYNINENLKLNDQNNLIHTNLAFGQLFVFLKNTKLRSIFILFPDPWPKIKHKKRRLINVRFVNKIYKILENFGSVYLATDNEEYLESMKYDFLSQNLFEVDYIKDYSESFSLDHLIKTKYFLRAQSCNKKITFIKFRKKKT